MGNCEEVGLQSLSLIPNLWRRIQQRLSSPFFYADGYAFLLAMILRGSLLNHQTNDYRYYLEPWYNHLQTQGGFFALKDHFSNYTPPYLYFLAIVVTFLGELPKVVGIKLITFPFELLCAYFAAQCVKLKFPDSPFPRIAFFTLLFAPTLILNGSYWGQCDVIYTTGLIACLYYLCRQRENWALIAFGMAVSFKQQALFLLPLLIILTLKKYISPMAFCWIPTVYLLAIFPTLLLGRPLPDLLLIYVNQANTFKHLTLNAPNLYQWIPNDYYAIMAPLGIILAIAVLSTLILSVGQSRVKITPPLLILLATLVVLLMPYFLPKMHDRYFFAADMISILYGFYFPPYFFVPVAINLVSLFSYFPFLWGVEVIPLKILSLVLAGVMGVLVYHLRIALAETAEQIPWGDPR